MPINGLAVVCCIKWVLALSYKPILKAKQLRNNVKVAMINDE